MSFANFLYSQLFKTLPYPSGSFHGKAIVITGSNTGLGKEAARHYARLGAKKLILGVRNLEKGEQAKADIEATTKCGKDVLEVWKVDMASYDSVLQFASKVNELERVDIFIANAGVAPGSFYTLEDNEASITVNVVSTFLLAALVLPKLKQTASTFEVRPTLTIVSSEVHGHTAFSHAQNLDRDVFSMVSDKEFVEKHWDEQYPVSKLLEVFAVRAFAERYPSQTFPVTLNCINPGLCHSELGREIPGMAFVIIKALLARTTEAGSRTVFNGGASGVETHGQYLSDCQIATPADVVTKETGKVAQDRVWSELVNKLEAIKPGVMSAF